MRYDPAIHLDMDLQIGDMQLCNNYTVLHSRTGFEDYPEPERPRHMIRFWLTFRERRPLAQAFPAHEWLRSEPDRRGRFPIPSGSVNAQPPRLSVREILQPRSVAVFGASEDRDKFGGRIMHFLVRHGFAGEIVPINPRPREILGHMAYASLADAPVKPEVAILAVPVNHLLPAVEQCAAAGIGCCVIIRLDLPKRTTPGLNLQQRILEIALPVGMRIIGPNCMGLINPLSQLALCSSVVLDTESCCRAAWPDQSEWRFDGILV